MPGAPQRPRKPVDVSPHAAKAALRWIFVRDEPNAHVDADVYRPKPRCGSSTSLGVIARVLDSDLTQIAFPDRFALQFEVGLLRRLAWKEDRLLAAVVVIPA